MIAPATGAPVISDAPQRHVIYQHFVVGEEEIPRIIGVSFGALYAHIADAHLIPAGPPFVAYNTAQSPWDIDVCAPVSGSTSPTGEILYKELPATRIVSMTNVGPYEELGQAYDVMEAFIRDNGLTMAGSPREIYLSPPETPPNEIQTILEWPIE